MPGPELVDQIGEGLRRHILGALPQSAATDLADEDLDGLLLIYANWTFRCIPTRARRVHVSNELARNPLRAAYADAIAAMGRKIVGGEDLRPHLSADVRKVHGPTERALADRDDLDLLLADWHIHHLHLGTRKTRRGLVHRTDDLLFAAFRPNDAYLIDIQPHGRWANDHLIRTIVSNWPDEGLVHVSRDLRPTRSYGEEDRLDLRSHGVSIILDIDGAAVLPGGLSLAGMPMFVSQNRNRVWWALEYLRQHLTSNPNYFDDQARSQGINLPPGDGWQPLVEDGWFGAFRDGCFAPVDRILDARWF